MADRDRSALVLFSGGQDSSTCLAWALERFEAVETIAFDYGQRHRVELECRLRVLEAIRLQFPNWGEKLGEDHLIDLGLLGQISNTALTSEAAIALRDDGLPNTFVPGRNLLFLTIAAAVAARRGRKHLVGGMSETDFSGYPDCRDDALKALQVALNLGMTERPGDRFVIHAPLMWLDKAATWRLADSLGGDALMRILIDETHTCYLGDRGQRHDWGWGCGACLACELRAQGHAAFRKD